jgi:Domain of unknown function (DUF4249)
MPVNKNHILVLLCLICSSCVEPFEPELEETQSVMVISGKITDRPGRHTLSVSRSSPYTISEFRPVEFCIATVSNQEGDMLEYTYEGSGIYSVDVPDSFLDVGDAASLMVLTPSMREYRSDYDTILPCPDFDSLYYEIQEKETIDPERNVMGIQFYLDMSGPSTDSRNLLWQVEETWEYWASLFGTHIWLADGTHKAYRSYPIFKCWKSKPIDQLYTATTRNLSANRIKRMALHYVSNETDRLSVTYSIQVKQQSLSGDAYDYFQRLNEQAAESGGMYDIQPSSLRGNLYSVNDPEELVLGYFHAAQLREKKIFVHNNNLFEFYVPHISCEYQSISSYVAGGGINYPIYIYAPGPFLPTWTGPSECFDCRLQGGDTIRPLNWESWE